MSIRKIKYSLFSLLCCIIFLASILTLNLAGRKSFRKEIGWFTSRLVPAKARGWPIVTFESMDNNTNFYFPSSWAILLLNGLLVIVPIILVLSISQRLRKFSGLFFLLMAIGLMAIHFYQKADTGYYAIGTLLHPKSPDLNRAILTLKGRNIEVFTSETYQYLCVKKSKIEYAIEVLSALDCQRTEPSFVLSNEPKDLAVCSGHSVKEKVKQ